jgi:predicted MFS family arabinose efflux permease
MELTGGVGQRRTPVSGMTRAEALRSPKLYLLIVVIFILSAACGIQQQIPSVLSGYGFTTNKVSAMVSFFTAALAVGKILQGLLYSKLGPHRGGYLIVAIFAISFPVIMQPSLAYPGLALLAVGMGCVTTLMPIVTRFVFGAREYAAIWSILSTASSVGSLIATPLFGMAYDATGSYTPAMAVSAVALFVSIPILAMAFKKK